MLLLQALQNKVLNKGHHWIHDGIIWVHFGAKLYQEVFETIKVEFIASLSQVALIVSIEVKASSRKWTCKALLSPPEIRITSCCIDCVSCVFYLL